MITNKREAALAALTDSDVSLASAAPAPAAEEVAPAPAAEASATPAADPAKAEVPAVESAEAKPATPAVAPAPAAPPVLDVLDLHAKVQRQAEELAQREAALKPKMEEASRLLALKGDPLALLAAAGHDLASVNKRAAEVPAVAPQVVEAMNRVGQLEQNQSALAFRLEANSLAAVAAPLRASFPLCEAMGLDPQQVANTVLNLRAQGRTLTPQQVWEHEEKVLVAQAEKLDKARGVAKAAPTTAAPAKAATPAAAAAPTLTSKASAAPAAAPPATTREQRRQAAAALLKDDP